MKQRRWGKTPEAHSSCATTVAPRVAGLFPRDTEPQHNHGVELPRSAELHSLNVADEELPRGLQLLNGPSPETCVRILESFKHLRWQHAGAPIGEEGGHRRVYSCGWWWNSRRKDSEGKASPGLDGWVAPDPAVVEALRLLILPEKLQATCWKTGKFVQANQVIVTDYSQSDSTTQGMPAHVDRYELGDVVYGVTIKGEGAMEFTRDGYQTVKVSASVGEAYLMTGDSRWQWSHCPFGNRCSITVRAVPWAHPDIELFGWVYARCDKEAMKLAKKFREVLNLEDRSASGEVLERTQKMKVVNKGSIALALLRELSFLPPNAFEIVTSKPRVAAALLLELESLPPDSGASSKNQDLRLAMTQAAEKIANEQPNLEAPPADAIDTRSVPPAPALEVEALELSVDSVSDAQASGQQAKGEAEATSQEHRRPRPRGGRSHHQRRYNR